MRTHASASLDQEITDVTRQLAAVNQALEKAPGYRKNSHWYSVRVSEKQALLGQLDRLREQARTPALLSKRYLSLTPSPLMNKSVATENQHLRGRLDRTDSSERRSIRRMRSGIEAAT
jgi:hypothetical protein